jgi:hypothetical protein
MTMRRRFGARFLASAFLLGAGLLLPMRLRAAERVRFAAERPDGGCVAPLLGTQPGAASLVGTPNASASPAAVLGIARLAADRTSPADVSTCLLVVPVGSLDDAALDAATQRLTAARSAAATILSIPASDDAERFAYAVKRLASVARSASPDGRVGLDTPQRLEGDLAEQLGPYADARVFRPSDDPPPEESEQRIWVLTPSGAGSPADAAIAALARFPRRSSWRSKAASAARRRRPAALSRLQRYLTADVSPIRPRPREAPGRQRGGRGALLRREGVHADPAPAARPAGALSIELAGGPFDTRVGREPVERRQAGLPRFGRAHAEPRRVAGDLAVVLHPTSRGGPRRGPR